MCFSGKAIRRRTKTTTRLVLVGRSQEIITRAWGARRLDCPFLFHGRRCPRPRYDKKGNRLPCLGTLRSAWERGCMKAGFAAKVQKKDGTWKERHRYRFHDTRHCGVTHLTGLGIPDPVGRSISGHKDPASYADYSHTQDAAQRAALERVNTFIEEYADGAAKVTPLDQTKVS